MMAGAVTELTNMQVFRQSLERQFQKTPKTGGGGGNNGSGNDGGNGKGRGGGGGGGDGEGFDHLSKNERFRLKNQFAKECLLFTQNEKYKMECEENPMKLLSDIQKVRDIIDNDFSFFKPGFDAGRKSIHYYCLRDALPDLSLQLGIYITDAQLNEVTNKPPFPQMDFPEADMLEHLNSITYLNKDKKYIMNHMICDFDNPCLEQGSPYIEALKEMNFLSVFIPHHLIYREVATVLENDREFQK